uniref:Tc1-like transposase DDE domain-containing protein n=1 Tax=Oncorhynchus tshawytscha TaxID=74940 RepID=A0AAZ3PUP8_ONCTS
MPRTGPAKAMERLGFAGPAPLLPQTAGPIGPAKASPPLQCLSILTKAWVWKSPCFYHRMVQCPVQGGSRPSPNPRLSQPLLQPPQGLRYIRMAQRPHRASQLLPLSPLYRHRRSLLLQPSPATSCLPASLYLSSALTSPSVLSNQLPAWAAMLLPLYSSLPRPRPLSSHCRSAHRTMTQHTSRLCKGYLTKKESDGVLHQMSWPPQSPDLNPIEMVWDYLDCRVKEKQPASSLLSYVGTPRLFESIPGWRGSVAAQLFSDLSRDGRSSSSPGSG